MADNSPADDPADHRFPWAGPGGFAVVLGLALGAFFYPVLVEGRSFFYRDYGVLGYPVVAYARDCFWRARTSCSGTR